MKLHILIGGALSAALLMSSANAAERLQSGPPVGKNIPGPFHPLNVTGGFAGQKQCLV